MSKIRDLRVLIGAAALATASTSAAFAVVAATAPVGVQAEQVCEGYTLLSGGRMVCHDFGTGALCEDAGVAPVVGVTVCVPD